MERLKYRRGILQVDALEKRAKEILGQVHSLRDSVRPVNRLPPEVLASCATFVSDADLPIIPLTHVCQYWRESIVSNPGNWKSLGIAWERLVSLCIGRAGAVPLILDVTVSNNKGNKGFLDGLLPHVPRIGTLRLTGYLSAETMADDLSRFFASPMLGLTSLELQQIEEPTPLFPSENSPVPPPFLIVSKLRSLSLTRKPLYPTLFTITSLVELKLNSPFHFDKSLRLLSSNSGLEHIVLDIQFIADSVETVLAREVPLPRLRDLSVTCSKPIDSKGLPSCITFPRDVHLEVVFTQPDLSAKLGSFLPSPPTPIRNLLTPITTIKTRATPRELHVFGNGSTFAFRSPKAPLATHLELALFPGDTVRELLVNIGPFKYSGVGLSRLPALETLAFTETVFLLGLLSALTKEPVLCPALRTIAFFDCGINSDIIEELGDAITKRRESTTTRLYRVVIVSSTGTLPNLKVIQRLRSFVPCVEVRVDDKLPDLA